MIRNRGVRSIYIILLAGVVSVSVTMLTAGCNTAQSPNRQADDLTITTEVKAKLASDITPSTLTNIEVNTTNGVVTLAGQVESAEVKRSAETITASIPGVVRVNNNLQVDPAAESIVR